MTTSLPILNFHSLDNRPSAISFPPLLFRRAMATLRERGYRSLTMPQVVRSLRRGGALPQGAFALTFDDGYRSVYEHAFPLLQEFGFSATLFITAGTRPPTHPSTRLPALGDRPMLSWQEISEMYRWGVAIGSHTMTHPDLRKLPTCHVEEELSQSKRIIEDVLGTAVNCFAYPYGSYDARCREMVKLQYDCACSTRLGLVKASSDVYALERVESYYLRSQKLFGLVTGPLFPIYLLARRGPRALRSLIRRGHE